MMQQIVDGVVLSFPTFVRQLCLVWRGLTYAWISEGVWGIMEGGIEPRTL